MPNNIEIDPNQLQFWTQLLTVLGVIFAAVRSYMNGRSNADIKKSVGEVHVLVNGNNAALRSEIMETRQEIKDLNERLMQALAAPVSDTSAATADTVARAINAVNDANASNAATAVRNVADAAKNVADAAQNALDHKS